MSQKTSRRQFIKQATYTGIGVFIANKSLAEGYQTPNEKINFACIGVGGKGQSDTMDASRFGNLVALCDVDDNTLNKMGQRFPNARKFNDFREMLRVMDKEIDAVTVSTPDHCHAVAAATAMHMGKHCFCQKPLTHNIYEAMALGDLAKRNKLATQMGNQGSSTSGLRKAAAKIRAGAIGTVKEIHIWTNRPIWPQGIERPSVKPVPDNLHWDLWLGPAKERPYGDGYHTFAWRGWWDFGTGAIGDMACHTMNLPFRALDLHNPISVKAESGGHNRDSYPKWAVVHYEFDATKERPAIPMTWYEGGKMPPSDLFGDIKPSDSGSLIIGDKGSVYTPGDYGDNAVFIEEVKISDVNFEVSPGHFDEYARAIKGGAPAMSNFHDFATPLTITALLGNLAVWGEGKKIEWDYKKRRVKNAPELAEMVRPKYRKGYSL